MQSRIRSLILLLERDTLPLSYGDKSEESFSSTVTLLQVKSWLIFSELYLTSLLRNWYILDDHILKINKRHYMKSQASDCQKLLATLKLQINRWTHQKLYVPCHLLWRYKNRTGWCFVFISMYSDKTCLNNVSWKKVLVKVWFWHLQIEDRLFLQALYSLK